MTDADMASLIQAWRSSGLDLDGLQRIKWDAGIEAWPSATDEQIHEATERLRERMSISESEARAIINQLKKQVIIDTSSKENAIAALVRAGLVKRDVPDDDGSVDAFRTA